MAGFMKSMAGFMKSMEGFMKSMEGLFYYHYFSRGEGRKESVRVSRTRTLDDYK